jgi:hypothetical protein
MAIQTAQAPRATRPAVRPAAGPGLFGTGSAMVDETDLFGATDLAADLAAGLAAGLAVGVLGVEPRRSTPGAPAPALSPRRRTLRRRAATWGAGPDGGYLAWRATPVRVFRLGGGPDTRVARSPAVAVPAVALPAVPAAVAAPPTPAAPVDPDLEAAIAFATDFSVDLLRTPVRLAPPAPRRTAPVRALLAGLRGLARVAAEWGSGAHGARLAWDRPVSPQVYGLRLPPVATADLRHRAPEDDQPAPVREQPGTPSSPAGARSDRPVFSRVTRCSPRARSSPGPSGWSPRPTGSPVPQAWRPSRPVGTRSMPRQLRDSPCRSSSRTSTARGARSRSSSPAGRGQTEARAGPGPASRSSSPVRA